MRDIKYTLGPVAISDGHLYRPSSLRTKFVVLVLVQARLIECMALSYTHLRAGHADAAAAGRGREFG